MYPSLPSPPSQTERKRSQASSMSVIASCRKVSFRSSSSANTWRIWSSYRSPCAIAFWKMVGFDVTPVTASSSSSRASPPLVRSSRERLSIHTLWPSSDSSCRRELAMIRPFHRLDFLQSPQVTPAAVEPCPEERPHELAGKLGADDLGTQTENVHIVVLYPLVRGVRVMADRGADSGELAGGDGGTDTGAADEDAALRPAVQDRLADLAGLVRIIDPWLGLVGTQVHRLVTEPGELREHAVAQPDSPVIERDRDSHRGQRSTPPDT